MLIASHYFFAEDKSHWIVIIIIVTNRLGFIIISSRLVFLLKAPAMGKIVQPLFF